MSAQWIYSQLLLQQFEEAIKGFEEDESYTIDDTQIEADNETCQKIKKIIQNDGNQWKELEWKGTNKHFKNNYVGATAVNWIYTLFHIYIPK